MNYSELFKKPYVPEPFIPTGFVIKRSTQIGIRSFLELNGLNPKQWNAMNDEDQDTYYKKFDSYLSRRASENRGGGGGE